MPCGENRDYSAIPNFIWGAPGLSAFCVARIWPEPAVRLWVRLPSSIFAFHVRHRDESILHCPTTSCFSSNCLFHFIESRSARRRAYLSELSPIARVFTCGNPFFASSLRTWPGGISRKRPQRNSSNTDVMSCQRTPWEMLSARSVATADAERTARPFTFAM